MMRKPIQLGTIEKTFFSKMVLLKDKEALEKQIQYLNKQIEQMQKAEQLYQQKIKSIENELLTHVKQKTEKIKNLEEDLQNEKQDNVKIKEKLNILEAISNKPKKEVSTGTNLNWDEKIRELYEKLKNQNTKEEQLYEENKYLKEKVNELEKILEPYDAVTTLSITDYNKYDILEPLLKY